MLVVFNGWAEVAGRFFAFGPLGPGLVAYCCITWGLRVFSAGRGSIAKAVAKKAGLFREISPPGWPIFPQNNKLDSCLPMLKTRKWREGTPKTAMHYALCNIGSEHTGQTSFPPKPNAFSELCIISICIITISTVVVSKAGTELQVVVSAW
jgi:hypothetical protein